jgi:hypothetical protein
MAFEQNVGGKRRKLGADAMNHLITAYLKREISDALPLAN